VPRPRFSMVTYSRRRAASLPWSWQSFWMRRTHRLAVIWVVSANSATSNTRSFPSTSCLRQLRWVVVYCQALFLADFGLWNRWLISKELKLFSISGFKKLSFRIPFRFELRSEQNKQTLLPGNFTIC
jgi:hypothetical protein